MKVGEIRVDLDDPIRLDEDDCGDEDEADAMRQEWFDLHPRDHVV